MAKKEDSKYNSIAVAQAIFVFFILFGLLLGLVVFFMIFPVSILER